MDTNIDGCEYIGKYIGEIHRISCMHLSKKFSKFGIGSGQYLFLLNLYKNEGITQEELSEKLKLDKATTARAIKKLELEGYVTRSKRENDRRAYSLMTTKKAQIIKEEVYLIMNEWEHMVKNCFTEEESKALMSLLRKLTNSSLFSKEEFYE